ncbi:protein STPG4-like [Clavelina lepadiformis]|uniref:protein STPG4-like n=1 Tax=Clavelina lepadiformis TaxID=159417 RepID=UPI0040431615
MTCVKPILQIYTGSRQLISNENSAMYDSRQIRLFSRRSTGQMKKKSCVKFKQPTRIENLLQSRVYSAYARGRKDPSEDYEETVSNREWWRVFIKETPVPGHYEHRDFVNDGRKNPTPATYNFTSQGRRKEPGVTHKGEFLMPGLYQYNDFIQEIKRRPATYSFKSCDRSRIPSGFQDKDANVPPWQYNITNEVPVRKGTKQTTSAFRSQSSRLASTRFYERKGPPPGTYNPCMPVTRYAMSSCFRSATARFNNSHTKVPGPGTYEPNKSEGRVNTPITINQMGRMHGLFFSKYF